MALDSNDSQRNNSRIEEVSEKEEDKEVLNSIQLNVNELNKNIKYYKELKCGANEDIFDCHSVDLDSDRNLKIALHKFKKNFDNFVKLHNECIANIKLNNIKHPKSFGF